MSQPTSGELTLLRTQPQRTKLSLSIYQPPTVYTARVTGSAAKNDRVINYYDPSGDLNDLRAGMTVYVGSTPGARDKGSIYLFHWEADNITVGENSHINWANGDYLTIVNFFQIWPLYPRYVQDEENITVYKAFDVEYTNQNEILGQIVCMGPHHAGYLDGGQHRVYWSAVGTENMLGESMTYEWSFEGGTPTGSSVQTPGYVTWDTPGHYTVQLTVTSDSGAQQRSYRHVSIYDRQEQGTSWPINQWEMQDFSGSRTEGGYTMRVTVHESLEDVVDGALVVVFADDWYGDTIQSIGGNAPGRQRIVFVGYIMDGTIEYNYQRGTVTFDIGSPSEVMKIGEAFSVSVQDSENPVADAANPNKGGSPWFYVVNLSVKVALHHYLKWHTTVNLCNDVQYISADKLIQYFDADRSSIWDALNSLMMSTVIGASVCDRQGKLFFEIDAQATESPESVFTENMLLDRMDRIGSPSINERKTEDLSYIEVGGVVYDGNESVAVLASAPGTTPAYRGSNERINGLAADSQEDLNQIAGNMFAWRNSRYPEVSIDLAGNYRNFDIVPQEIVRLTVDPNETPSNVEWEGKAFIPASMFWDYNGRQQSFRGHIVLNEMTDGFDADSVSIPVEPPGSDPEAPPFDVPPPVIIPSIGGRYVTLNYVIDGGGVISTGIKGDMKLDFPFRIDEVALLAQQTGSIVIDIWASQYEDAPPTDTESITASSPPTLSGEEKSKDTTLSGWTRTFSADTYLRFNVDSVSLITRVTISLKLWRD